MTVWGVDVAADHVSVAIAQPGNGPIEAQSLFTSKGLREGERMGLLDRQLRIWFRQLANGTLPDVVWVELPVGKFVHPALMQAVGVTLASAYEALGVHAWCMSPPDWKKRSVGKGNARKQDVQDWCFRMNYSFSSEDEADAIAIAYAGRARMVGHLDDAAVIAADPCPNCGGAVDLLDQTYECVAGCGWPPEAAFP